MFKKNKILITGAAGFIGSALCRRLCAFSQITGLDYSTKNDSSLDANWINSDINDFDYIKTVIKKENPDVIIHCAGIAHQKIGSVERSEYFRVNSQASEYIAKIAAENNPDLHFIFLSSISVYGEKKSMPINENDPCEPSSDYSSSKLDAENRLVNLFDEGIINRLDILRLAPVYDSKWSLNLDRRIFLPKKIAYVQFGKGTQTMSAVSKNNLIGFIDYLIINNNLFGEKYFNIYNVCDEKAYSFNYILKTFRSSRYQPDRILVIIPLPIVWLLTRIAGFVVPNKKPWLHSCYDKLARDLVFDNQKMLQTGFQPQENIENVFLNGNKLDL